MNNEKKVESLEQLKEVVLKKKKLASGFYIDPTGESCAVGHLLKLNGVSEKQLQEIENGKYDYEYEIAYILKVSVHNEMEDEDFVGEALKKAGFDPLEDLEWLIRLQGINDDYNGDTKEVVQALDEWIDALKSA